MMAASRSTEKHRGATMRVADCARRLSATLVGAPPDLGFQGVATDSRSIAANELFVALVGTNFDGHAYLEQALARGAAAAVVSTRCETALPQIVVGDTLWAYGQLAQFWRSQFCLPTIALTGSNGKTTVKEMLRSICTAHVGDANNVLATEGNLNNAIGVPQMMLRLASQHQMAVFEMGMNHLHEIDYLTRLVVPDVALIIMAGTAHIGELGSREAIAQAKGEIYAGLRDDGIACVNADDRFADYWTTLIGQDNRRRLIRFGTAASAEVRGELLVDHLKLHLAGKSAVVRLQMIGEHNQRNAIAAAAAAHALNVPLEAIVRGLESCTGVAGRLRSYAGHNGATIIDDTYNANPDSMRAAIAVLAAKPGKRVLVLGDMGELGEDAAAMHAEIGREARAAKLDALFGFGELATEYVAAFGAGATHNINLDSLVEQLKANMQNDTTVLVKGSRFMRMERVVEAVTKQSSKGTH
jgi:UDP-N-acetylmuramoyl-tripeptide--D-alanyl-D-alanine ligase